MTHLHDFPLFFSQITKLFIDEPDFFRLFRSEGLSANDWPTCDAKRLAVSFEAIASEKSIEAAKVTMRSKMVGLGSYPIPHEIGEIWALYAQMRTFGVWYQAGQRIVSDPMRGLEIASEVRSPKNSKSIWVQEVIEGRIAKRLIASKNREVEKVILPDWTKLSKGIGGFNPGRVFLFVAGTGVGKTTLSLNLVTSAIKTPDFAVLFINMEMVIDDILDRVTSIVADTRPDWPQHLDQHATNKVIASVQEIQSRANLFVTDGRALSIEEISAQIIQHVETEGVRLVIVDYDQKIRTRFHGEEWQVIQKAVEQLEEIAKSTGTAIVILAQGDEKGDPKASKRSAQPCSAVVSLFREGDAYLLETKKNRFGKPFRLSLETNFEKYQIKEGNYDFQTQSAPTDLRQKLFGQHRNF